MNELVVTPNRVEQRLRDVPDHVTVLAGEDLRQSPALTVDDLLRQVPGFSLFRRSSSLVSHPTTQGVTLRGIAPSGVSRALVLLDGVPLNDPFGGWVYWSLIPRDSVQRIEVVHGGGSTAWGNYALGGVIHVLTEPATENSVRFTGVGGNRGTFALDSAATGVRGPLAVSVEGDVFDTDGYRVVRDDQRGAIDTNADSEHKLFRGKLSYALSPTARVFLNGSYFDEGRDNGTPLTHNDTHIGLVSAGGEVDTDDGSHWKLTTFSELESFASTFSSQAADRSSETPSLDQFDVPSKAVGAGLQWTRHAFGDHLLTAGPDFRWVDGETNESFRFIEGEFTRRRKAGGEQQIVGFFGQDVFPLLPRLEATVGARVDVWRSLGLFRREQDRATGAAVTDQQFGDRDRTAVSPKVAFLYRAAEHVSLRAGYYQAFRTPTLNELVRPFRVRNDITEANAGLDPERLVGGEIGADYVLESFLGRLTGFWNEVKDPIANVTVGTGPGTVAPCGLVPEGGTCRQRQNLDHTRIRGVEAEANVIPARSWLASASYLFSDAEVTEAGNQPALEGKRIAQVPRHQVVLKIAYDEPSLGAVAVQARYVARQFEDDLNTLALGSFAVVDLYLGRELRPGVAVFFSIENLLDRTYQAGKTADGIVTTGAPVLAHGGLRLRF